MHAPDKAQDEAEGSWIWPLAICGYFAFHALYRRLLGAGLGLDEAQMLLWSQSLAWSYGPQPPLYSWLQWVALHLAGDPLLALTLLKNALLASFSLAVYGIFRIAHPPAWAGFAAASLILMPNISWDLQRDLTHSILVMTVTALTTLVFLTRTLPGRHFGWPLFGLCIGLGLISKINFALVPPALLLAAASLPELRHTLSLRGIGVAALVAAVIVAPPLIAAILQPELSLASAGELKRSTEGLFAPTQLLQQIGAFCLAVLDYAYVAVPVLAFLLWRYPAAVRSGHRTLADRFLLRVLCIGLALTALCIVVTGIMHVRSLWLLPVVYLGVPLATIETRRRITRDGARLFFKIFAGLAILVVAGLAVHLRYGDPGHPTLYRAPVGDVADEIAVAYPAGTRFVASSDWLAGSLIYFRPGLRTVGWRSPGPAPQPGDPPPVLLFWDEERGEEVRILAALSLAWSTEVTTGERITFAKPFDVQPAARVFDVEAVPLSVAGTVAAPGPLPASE